VGSVVETHALSYAAQAGDLLTIQKLATTSCSQNELDCALLAAGVGLGEMIKDKSIDSLLISEKDTSIGEKLKNIEVIIHILLGLGANPKYWNDKPLANPSKKSEPSLDDVEGAQGGSIFNYVARYGNTKMMDDLLHHGFLKSNSYRFTDYLQQIYQIPFLKEALQKRAELNNFQSIDGAWTTAVKDLTSVQKEVAKLLKRMTYHASWGKPKLMFENDKDTIMHDMHQENKKVLQEIKKIAFAPVSFWQNKTSSMFNGESFILPKGIADIQKIFSNKDLALDVKVTQIQKIAAQKIPINESLKKEDYYVHKSEEELFYKIILSLFKDRRSPDNFSFPAKALDKLLELAKNASVELRPSGITGPHVLKSTK
jgi:hypothetical protein